MRKKSRTTATRPKKSLGQHFLIDPHITQKIIDVCDLEPQETILEIGPGKGILTEPIAGRVKSVIAVETDSFLVEFLQKRLAGLPVTIIHADVLKYEIPSHRPLKVVGNLPYYISTPIIEKLITHRRKISFAYITLQREFALRLTALPGSKSYGSLSCFIQFYSDAKILLKIGRFCFFPPPKVESCLVRLRFLPGGRFVVSDEGFLFSLIQTAFSQRRKKITNALEKIASKGNLTEALKELGLSPHARAENLSLEDFVRLANRLHNPSSED